MTLDEILAEFWRMARGIVAKADAWQPDCVIALLHGGWLPVYAAQTLWRETRRMPFPPTLRTNLGQEKWRHYAEWRQAQGMPPFNGFFSRPVHIGHFLHWLTGQRSWQDELRAQIRAARRTPDPPASVLVFDDIVVNGATVLCTLGLLRTLYPRCEARCLAGRIPWRHDLPRDWLAQRHPELVEVLGGPMSGLETLVLGTEDVASDSLNWQSITTESDVVQQLVAATGVPHEEWLSLPAWAGRTIGEDVRRRACDPFALRAPAEPLACYTLDPHHLLCQAVWEYGWVTLHEAAAFAGIADDEAWHMLGELVARGELVQVGERYMLGAGVFGT